MWKAQAFNLVLPVLLVYQSYISMQEASKFDELAATIDALQPIIICIVESWLSEEISDSEISIEGYMYSID